MEAPPTGAGGTQDVGVTQKVDSTRPTLEAYARPAHDASNLRTLVRLLGDLLTATEQAWSTALSSPAPAAATEQTLHASETILSVVVRRTEERSRQLESRGLNLLPYGVPFSDQDLSKLEGVSVRLQDGTLAGSAATMDELVRRMARLPGMDAARALTMASTAPARVLGERGLGRIRTGACADLVLLDADLKVPLTMIGGTVRYRR
jgi:hypothetical protein